MANEREETLEEALKELITGCKELGEDDLSIVMHSYLKAMQNKKTNIFARHCQKFNKQKTKNKK